MRGGMEIPSFEKRDEMWGRGPKCESGDGGRSILGSNLNQVPTSSQFRFLNLPSFLLEARDPWICRGFHLTGMVLHTTIPIEGD